MPLTGKEEPSVLTKLSRQEHNLILMIRELDYGNVFVTVKDGKPIRAEEVRKSILL